MDESEKYLFDVHGYIVIKGALSAEELSAANTAMDHHSDQISVMDNSLANSSPTLFGKTGRGNMGNMLTWEKPYCDVFRNMMIHPAFVSRLETVLGKGFRLEGMAVGAITMDEGAGGFWFHEGGEPIDPSRAYLYRNGRMYCGMTNIAVQLTDVGPGDGGFACLPGSHKANFPCPDDIRLYEAHQDRIVQITARAGDAIIFTESLMHGALPWTAKHQRRTILMRYNAGTTGESIAGTYTPPPFYDELTEKQRAIITAPHYRQPDKGSKLYKSQ
ncbi:MAG TPA: hypothetical protein EYQ20_02605 [candidate division Zixibacteria bacterium]|jgi:hypothetical protein|nr:hypothetical protein [candidate division Zixibacteria bacterium]